MFKKRIVVPVVVVALVLCGIAGVRTFYNPQEPVTFETVGDELDTEALTGQKQSDGSKGKLQVAAKSAVLIDAATGKVLFRQDEHKELPPASVTKVMTMLLALEAVDDGKVKLSDKITISELAASMGGSQMYMEVGEEHTLEELLEGIAIVSANDACVAVSEYVAGSEDVFVEKMNQRAKELGLRDTNFVNTNGLPVADHYTSTYDIAQMSRLLITHKETHKWFTTWQKMIKVGLPGKEKEFGLTNTNKLIKQYPGANGVKTGFTQEAGYCLSASATRGDTTLIAVAFGCETAKIRNGEIAKLLNYGFANYASVKIAEKGQQVKKVQLMKGKPQTIGAITEENISALVKKGDEKNITYKSVIDKKIKLPLKKGDKIGKLKVYNGKKPVGEYNLVGDKSVEKASFITYYIRKIKKFI